ncbi:MAG: hypothetical protein JSV13_09485 [Nitrospiraceae bacterium]|nr:MAG: hypothetical protein JSV13_09485 [Nitrospiraceae bacterium]
MKRRLTFVTILLVVAFAGVSSAGVWETKCLMCHKEGNTMKAPTKAAMLEKHKTGDDFMKAAKASKNPMMKMQKDDVLNAATKELYP